MTFFKYGVLFNYWDFLFFTVKPVLYRCFFVIWLFNYFNQLYELFAQADNTMCMMSQEKYVHR